MIDQGLRLDDGKGGFYFGYGGDFGDEINDLQFCINVSKRVRARVHLSLFY